MVRHPLVLAAAIALAGAEPAMGQVQLIVTLGGFIPVGVDPLISELGGVNGAPVPYPVLEKWQTGGQILTARGAWWVTGRAGIEGTFGLSNTLLSTRDSTNTVRATHGRMFLTSVRGALRLNPVTRPVVVQLATGLGYINRAGRTWSGVGGTDDVAFVAAISAQGKWSRRSRVFFRLELEDYVSRAQYSVATWTPTVKQTHHDMTFSLGVGFPFTPRRRSLD